MLWFLIIACQQGDDDASATTDPTSPPLLLPDDAVALVGVDVLWMGDGQLLENHTVVVVGDRIEAVLGPDEVLPDGVEVLAEGGFVMPGLADMHVHNWLTEDHALFLANGVTTIRNLFGDPLHLGWRDEIAAGDRIGPTLLTSGPIVDGDPPWWPGSDVATDAEEGKAVVRAQANAGYDVIKVYNWIPREAWEAVLDRAARAELPVVGHVPLAMRYSDVVDSDQRTIEHLDGLTSELLGLWYWDDHTREVVEAALAALEPAELEALASRVAASGTFNVPTLTVLEHTAWGPAERDAFWDGPEASWVHPDIAASWRYDPGLSPPIQAGKDAKVDAASAWLGQLHAAGAPVVLGTDMGNPFVTAGFAVHHELAFLVAAGLTPFEALRAGTAVAAASMDQAGAWGTVEVGARADLLWLAADPRADLATVAVPQAVMARGRWLDRDALDDLLADVAASFGQPPPVPAQALAHPLHHGPSAHPGQVRPGLRDR